MARKRGFFAELQHQAEQQERANRRRQQEHERQVRRAQHEREGAERAQLKMQAQAEKEKIARYHEGQQSLALAMSNESRSRTIELDNVLLSQGTDAHQLTFSTLRKTFQPHSFAAGPLEAPGVPPSAENFAPPPSSAFRRIFAKTSEQRAFDTARQRFEAAQVQFQKQELARTIELKIAKDKHSLNEQQRRSEIDQHNAQVNELEKGVSQGIPDQVQDYYEFLLESLPLPPDIPHDTEVVYQPGAKKLLVNRKLPNLDIIPTAQEYSYVRARNEIKEKPVPEAYSKLDIPYCIT
jgi:restriction system protein